MDESGRYALVVSSSKYADSSLRPLNAPTEDAETLTELLRNHEVGGFRVRPVVDQPSWVVAEEIERFFAERSSSDIALLYFSGHGIKDEDGALYFATMNTDPKLLLATSVPSEHIVSAMRRSRSRRQVLLLDCCYAGAFSKAMLTKSDERVGVQERFAAEGTGRVVIAASDAMQFALEGGQLHGEPTLSVFTQVLVEGIETGEADADGDGRISIDELYDYIYDRVQKINPNQTPTTSNLDKRGDIVIALSRHPRAEPEPEPEPEPKPEPDDDDEADVVPPPSKGLLTRATDALRRTLRLPRRLRVGLGAGALAVCVVAVVAIILLRDGSTSDEWSLADASPAALDGPPTKLLKDVAAVGDDSAVAVGSDGSRPGVWSFDGTSWSPLDPQIESGSGGMNAVAASGETVVAVGSITFSEDEGINGAIWSRSGDGQWSSDLCGEACGGSGKQEILAVAATSTGNFIAAGRDTSTGAFDAAVWRLEDGSRWERVPDDGILGGTGDQVMKGVVDLGGRLVAVGRSGRAGAVWTSDDGGSQWRLSTDAFRISGGNVELEAVEVTGRRLIAVGREYSQDEHQNRAAAWFSDDRGARWEPATIASARFVGQQILDVIDTPSGLVAVGFDHRDGGDEQEAAVWQSPDGSEWTDVSSSSFSGAGQPVMRGVTLLSRGLLAVGDARDPERPTRDGRIWSSESEG